MKTVNANDMTPVSDERETVKVIFREDRHDPSEIVAFFPEMPGTNDLWTLGCYAHLGQHGAASLDYYQTETRRPQSPEKVQALREELRRVGYDLIELQRMHPAHHAARQAT